MDFIKIKNYSSSKGNWNNKKITQRLKKIFTKCLSYNRLTFRVKRALKIKQKNQTIQFLKIGLPKNIHEWQVST